MSGNFRTRGTEWYRYNSDPTLGPNRLPLLRVRLHSVQGSGTHLRRKRAPPPGSQMGGTHREHRPTLFGIGSRLCNWYESIVRLIISSLLRSRRYRDGEEADHNRCWCALRIHDSADYHSVGSQHLCRSRFPEREGRGTVLQTGGCEGVCTYHHPPHQSRNSPSSFRRTRRRWRTPESTWIRR